MNYFILFRRACSGADEWDLTDLLITEKDEATVEAECNKAWNNEDGCETDSGSIVFFECIKPISKDEYNEFRYLGLSQLTYIPVPEDEDDDDDEDEDEDED